MEGIGRGLFQCIIPDIESYLEAHGFGQSDDDRRIVVVRSWPKRGAIPAFTWRDRGKPRETAVGIAGIPADIQTEHLQNTEHYRCANLPV
jgi:hypothetical protein